MLHLEELPEQNSQRVERPVGGRHRRRRVAFDEVKSFDRDILIAGMVCLFLFLCLQTFF